MVDPASKPLLLAGCWGNGLVSTGIVPRTLWLEWGGEGWGLAPGAGICFKK